MPETLLEIRDVRKTYRSRRSTICALDGVSLSLAAGATLVIAGSSGSGKSTLVKCIARMQQPDSGEIRLDLPAPAAVQLMFQDPGMSLNPRFTAAEIVAEPLEIRRLSGDRRARVEQHLRAVGLAPETAGRRSGQFSGGERARLVLARALAAEPSLLILDESLSSLDLPVRARMIALLQDLQKRRGLTLIVVTHDLDVAAEIGTEIAVMEAGRIVERGPVREVFETPAHPQTRRLLDARPGRLA